VSYRTRIDLEFVEDGHRTVICPQGTVFEPVPEGALSLEDAMHFQRMTRTEATRNPDARLVAVYWRGSMRVLTIGHHLVAPRRSLTVETVPAPLKAPTHSTSDWVQRAGKDED
jgi:hypothetical protein